MSLTVQVNPTYNALYYSFYMAGLRRLGVRVGHRWGGFPAVGHHGLAFETLESPSRRIFLSASDGPGINPTALDWCDIYGKVNLDPDQVPAQAETRCLAIGPSFPVRIWGPTEAFIQALVNYLRCRGRLVRPREHFANFYRQLRYRLPLAAYEPAPSEPRYVFFAATLWKKEQATNRYRARFVEVCRSLPSIHFEGGFVPRPGADVPGFEQVTTNRRFPAAEYLAKTKRSAVVFNTPAVSFCHGWKLAEFLALGKAIISTPLVRALPAPLENGVHLHLVDGSNDAIRSAIKRITEDEAYRRKLEANARAYYVHYLSPERVIERVFSAAQGATP